MVGCRFNPRTPCGVRQLLMLNFSRSPLFQSTHSLRSATKVCEGGQNVPWFQSTHSLRSATYMFTFHESSVKVSIHALLAECDARKIQATLGPWSFNPRTPCGVRRIGNRPACLVSQFQSTHSLRSATKCKCKCKCSMWFQSTHSLRSATLRANRKPNRMRVSIHALLAECDA